MIPVCRKLVAVLVRDGPLLTCERLWSKLFSAIAAWRISHLLGRLRNLWRLPVLRRRHLGGRLNLGCGPDRRIGWINADLGLTGDIHMDVGRRFPFRDGFFSLIFTEHLLEHLTEQQATMCLSECHRVLQTDGVLRLSTPDLAKTVASYLAPAEHTEQARQAAAAASGWKYPPGTIPTPAQALNDGFYLWEHRHLYDEADLRQILRQAGFVKISFYQPGIGSTELTTGLEQRIDPNSLAVEACKATNCTASDKTCSECPSS